MTHNKAKRKRKSRLSRLYRNRDTFTIVDETGRQIMLIEMSKSGNNQRIRFTAEASIKITQLRAGTRV